MRYPLWEEFQYLGGIKSNAGKSHFPCYAVRVWSGFPRVLYIYNIVGFVDYHIAQLWVLVGHESGDISRREVCPDKLGKVHVQHDVSIMDQEKTPGQKGLCVLKCAAGAEEWILGEKSDALSIGATAHPISDHLGPVIKVHPDSSGADRNDLFEDDLDEGPSKHGKEGFRKMFGDGTQSLAKSC
jgi:hypothetical protein